MTSYPPPPGQPPYGQGYPAAPDGNQAVWSLVIAIVGIIVIGLFGYFNINIAAAFLGVTLIAEVVLLGALAFAVLFSGGGPDGLPAQAVNPLNAFRSLEEGGGLGLQIDGQAIAAGSAAIGLFFAFCLVRALEEEGLEVFVVPVGSLLGVCVVAAIAGVVTGLLPARRASRVDVLEAIGAE